MKSLPEALDAHLATGATTLCWCWRLVRRDGGTFGFTDHDRALSFDGTQFEAEAGFSASEIKESVGLSVDNLDVEGAVSSERLAEGDLAAGLYDNAQVEIFRVNWQDPSQRVLMRKGSIGEVRRTGNAFVAEIRGLAHALNQPRGRLYQHHCDAELGDARCQVDLAAPAFAAAATISAVRSGHVLEVSGLESFADAWFDRGLLTIESGANAGRSFQIKTHEVANDTARLTLWQPPPAPVELGATCQVQAGCDKTVETCRAKFSNALNFRGFPDMPGTAFVTTIHSGGR